MISTPDQQHRSRSFLLFKSFVSKLSNLEQVKMVIIEMILAPIPSIVTAGIVLFKELIHRRHAGLMQDGFVVIVLARHLMNFSSSLYTDDTLTLDIFQSDEMFYDRYSIVVHVLNLYKYLTLRAARGDFEVRGYTRQRYSSMRYSKKIGTWIVLTKN